MTSSRPHEASHVRGAAPPPHATLGRGAHAPAFESACEGCTALRVVRLVDCDEVTAAGLSELVELANGGCPGLALLVVSEAQTEDSEARSQALAALPARCKVARAAGADCGVL